MALTKFTGSTTTIQSLSDLPNQDDGLSAAQLKVKFDQIAIDAEAYLNDTLTVEIEADYATKDELTAAVIGELPENSVTDNYLSDTAGQIKDRVATNTTNISTINTTSLPSKVNKPTTATDGNIAVFDTDENAIKDSGVSINSTINIRAGARLGTIGTTKHYMPGWSSPVGVSNTVSVLTTVVTYIPIYLEKDTTIISVGSNHRNTTNSNLVIAFYTWLNGKPSAKIGTDITIIGSTTTGSKETVVSVTLSKGLYFIGCIATINDFASYSLAGQHHIFTANSNNAGSLQDLPFFTQTTGSLPTTANPTATATEAPLITIRED